MPIVDKAIATYPKVVRAPREPADQMDRNGVDRAVLIQILGQTDQQLPAGMRRRHRGRFSSVVLVDTESPTASEDLASSIPGGVSGVRLRQRHAPRATDPLAICARRRPSARGQLSGTAPRLATEEVRRSHRIAPWLPIVLEHLGAPISLTRTIPSERPARGCSASPRFPNVYIKVHGLGEFSRRAQPVREPFPFEEPIRHCWSRLSRRSVPTA